MNSYFSAVQAELKDWKKALLVVIFTVARLVYGWSWMSGGFEKIAWLSDGKINAAPKIQALITNIAGPKVTHFDPLYINKAFAWIAQHVFLGMPQLTDVLVVVFEFGIGLVMILGLRVFWAALVAMFMNTQFMAGASFNNFGYIWSNLGFLKFSRYTDLLGIDGYLRYKKGKQLL